MLPRRATSVRTSALRSALVVLVVAAPPEARLVATLGRAVEPLVHAPETVQPARICGIGVVDDAVLERERAHARRLSRIRCNVGSDRGRHFDDWTLRTLLRRRAKSLWAEVVHGNSRPLLLLRVARLEVVVEVASERRCPREAPPHPVLERLELRDRRARDGSEGDVVVGQVDDGAVEAIGNRGTRRTARRVVGPEHEVVDEELRAPAEEVSQRGLSLLGLEFVRLVDPDPRQLLPSPRQLVAAPRVLFLRVEQLEPGCKPLFTCPGFVLRHRSSPFPVSSTNALRRSAASSHCAAIWSRYRFALSRRSRFRSHTRSRPRRAWRTSPTSPSAWRWRVIACRVTPVPSLRRVIERGPPADRRPSRRSRVASPSAANNGTAPGGGSCSATALRLRDIPRELFDLAVPPVVVHAERFGATRERDAIEPGLDNRERSAAVRFLELELDQRRGLGRVVHGRVDGVGVPAIREVALRVDALDQHFQRHMLVARYAEPAPDRPALGKRALEFYAEPGAKLCRVRESAPHARACGAEHDPFFDPIGARRVVGRWGFDCHGLSPSAIR